MNQASAIADCPTVCPPVRIARGIALGVILGLIPKDNLTAVVLAASTLILPIHRSSAWICVLAVSLVFWGTDPWVGALGERILSLPLMGSVFGALSDLPILAWCSLNNTVVLGGLVFGCITYPLTRFSVRRIVQRIQHMQLQRQVDSLLLQAIEQSEDHTSLDSLIPASEKTPSIPESGAKRLDKDDSKLILRIDSGLESPRPKLQQNVDHQTPERQAGSSGTSTDRIPPPKHVGISTGNKSIPEPLPLLPIGGLLQETRIEITRFRKEHSFVPAINHSATTGPARPSTNTKPHEESETVHIVSVNEQIMQSQTAYQIVGVAAEASEQNNDSTEKDSVPTDISVSTEPREESLRFLLWHLSHREQRG